MERFPQVAVRLARVDLPDYQAGLRELPDGLTVGVPWSYLERPGMLDAPVMALFRRAVADLEALGMRVRPIEIPHVEHVDDVNTLILVAEGYTVHEAGFREHLELYGRPFQNRILRGALFSAADYLQATRARGRFQRGMTELMTEIDLIATPTSVSLPERFDDTTFVPYNRASTTRAFNVTGQPSISVPSGFTEEGLPLGLMLSGRPFEDRLVLQAAFAYEQLHDWRSRAPGLDT